MKIVNFLSKIFYSNYNISDYETGSIAGVNGFLLGVNQFECCFHTTQALLRKIQIVGLTTAYRNNDRFSYFVEKIFSLEISPIDKVIAKFKK